MTADWNFNDDVKLTSLVDLWHSQIIQLKCVRVRKPRHFMLLLYMQSWVKREDSPVLNIRWRVQKSINHKFRLLDWLCLIEYRVAFFFFTPAGLSFPFVWATHWCVLYIHLYTRHMLLVTQPIVFLLFLWHVFLFDLPVSWWAIQTRSSSSSSSLLPSPISFDYFGCRVRTEISSVRALKRHQEFWVFLFFFIVQSLKNFNLILGHSHYSVVSLISKSFFLIIRFRFLLVKFDNKHDPHTLRWN